MNNEQAKIILSAYRPGGEDAVTPTFTEALEQARRDPDLARWFGEERALDTAIARKLKVAPVPSHLENTILAGRKVIRPAVWWRQPGWLAAAAAVALLLGVGAMLLPSLRAPTLARLQTDAVGLLDGLDRLDLATNNLASVRAWLASRSAHEDLVVPAGLKAGVPLGCRIFDWQGRKVTLVCFKLDGPGGVAGEAHLLVVDASALRGAPDGGAQFAQRGRWATAAWREGAHGYVLATQGDEAKMRQLLTSAG
jgi:hypothetical protein